MPELKAKFTADDSQFSAKVDGLKGKIGGLRSMFGGLASGLSLAAAGAFIKSSVEMASELQDASDSIGMTTDALQAFRQEASRAGASAEKMEMALNKIAQARNEAISDPTGPAAKTFGKLFGMDASAAALKVEGFGDLETTVVAVGKALSAAGNDAEKLAAAFDLVGGRSKRMLEAIKAIGKSGVQGSFEQLDSPISVDTIASLDRFMDNLKEIGVAWKGFIATRAQENLQSIGMAPQTFEQQGKLAEQASARFKKLRAENEAFARKLTTGEDTPKPQSMVEKKLAEANAEAARKMQDKTMSAFSNISDPVAAIGRGAGKDFSYDAAMSLREIAANTRRIQPTPAPTMR